MKRALLMLLVAFPAAADPVLHEYVKPPRERGGRIVNAEADKEKDKDKPRSAEKNENPQAIRAGDKILVEPPSAEPGKPSEVVHGESGFAADRETEAQPDYITGADGTLHYVEVFNPSIVPFKRMSALDAVHADFKLGLQTPAVQPISAAGDTSPDRDLFWGSMLIKVPRGGTIAIPSVAPDMRVLSYEVEPKTKLVFLRDGADNFSVRAADPKTTGQFRLVFLVDAPAIYFAARVPDNIAMKDVAAGRAPAPLPPRIRASARVVLARVGVTQGMTANEVLDRLIDYFRGFEAGTPPASTNDIYLDLSLSRRGVCRHRAYAFMITANAAGLPARYVTNEAHAFAEVWLPGPGWLRVDLGGAALELDVTNANEKAMHRPRGADPFPKPRAYRDGYTRLRGDVQGLSSDQIAEAQRPPAPAGEGPADPTSTAPITPRRVDLPHAAPAPTDKRRRVPIVIDSVDRKAFRGEAIRVGGHLGDGESGPEGLRVDLYLAPAGAGGDSARAVAQTATDATGHFSVAVELPLDIFLGRYEVYAVTPGNADIAPAMSD